MNSRFLHKVTGILLVCLAAGATASAQYPGGGGTGGGGTGTGTGGYTSGSGYGNGKAIGIGVGVAAGGALAIGLLVHHHHVVQARSQASIVGCTHTGINELSVKNEKDDVTYTILANGTALQSGQRVELTGVASDGKSGVRTFRVSKLVNNFGTCGASATAAAKSAAPQQTAQAAIPSLIPAN